MNPYRSLLNTHLQYGSGPGLLPYVTFREIKRWKL